MTFLILLYLLPLFLRATIMNYHKEPVLKSMGFTLSWASLIAQLVKNPPAMQETLVQSLGQEDPLEKG